MGRILAGNEKQGRTPKSSPLARRLSELSKLKNGWLDGLGTAPDPVALQWLADTFARHWPAHLPEPSASPTESGGVEFEWRLVEQSSTLEVDLSTRTGWWHSLNLHSGAASEETMQLGSAVGWRRLVELIAIQCEA